MMNSSISSPSDRLSYRLIPFVAIGSGLWIADYTLISSSKFFAVMKELFTLDTSFLITTILNSFIRGSLFYGLITLAIVFCFNKGWRRSWQIAMAIVGASLLSGFIILSFFEVPEVALTMRSMIYEGNPPPYNEWFTRLGYCVIPAFLEGIGIAIIALFFINRHRLNWAAILLTPLCCVLPFMLIVLNGPLIQNLLPFGFDFNGAGPFAFALFFYMGRSRWPFFTPKESAPFRTRGLFFLGAFLLVFTGLTVFLAWSAKSTGKMIAEELAYQELTLTHVRFAEGDVNTIRMPATFQPGETVYVITDVYGYERSGRMVWLQEDLDVRYPDGSIGLHQENIIDYHQVVPTGGPVELTNSIKLPNTAQGGTYTVTITIRDLFARERAELKQNFEVRAPQPATPPQPVPVPETQPQADIPQAIPAQPAAPPQPSGQPSGPASQPSVPSLPAPSINVVPPGSTLPPQSPLPPPTTPDGKPAPSF